MVTLVYILSTEDPTESETLNITTYYPAPYGGYVSLLTTNNTYLARDAGSVGIGTASPGAKLDVRGGDAIVSTGGNAFRAYYTTGGTNYHGSLNWYGLQLGNNGANYIVAGRTATGGTLQFVVNNTSDFPTINGTTAMYINSAGNVGIGIGPSYKLDVNGDVRILGTLRGLCTWRYDNGGYYWHGCAGGEWIMGYSPTGWDYEGVCGGRAENGLCSYGGTRLVPTNGYMLCCRIQ